MPLPTMTRCGVRHRRDAEYRSLAGDAVLGDTVFGGCIGEYMVHVRGFALRETCSQDRRHQGISHSAQDDC